MPWRESAADLDRARAEQPVAIAAPTGRLIGIHTPPAPDAPPSGSCVVYFTRPRAHRNRMWVEGARRLAAQGFGGFRFDYHGCGDSDGVSARLDPNSPYRDDALAVLRHLRAQFGYTRFVVVGSCFDARTALSVFPAEGGSIDGLVFIAAPVMALDHVVAVDADRKDWAHLGRALRNPENWRSLASRERWRYMATVLTRVARRSVGTGDDGPPLNPGFVSDFRALVKSGARALFLYGADDAEYQSFRVAEHQLIARLDAAARARFEVEVWPGEVHGFLEMDRQREAYERAFAWIEALHPAHAHGGHRRAAGSR